MSDVKKFSEDYVPREIFILDTKHDISHDLSHLKPLKGVPEEILKNALKEFGKNHNSEETLFYCTVQDLENDVWESVLLFQRKRNNKNTRSIRLVIKDSDEDEVRLNNKMNILRIQYDPEWHGERGEPIQLLAETYDDMMEQLEKVGRKAQFEDIMSNGTLKDVTASGVYNEEQDLTEMAIDVEEDTPKKAPKVGKEMKGVVKQFEDAQLVKGKIPEPRRSTLVEKFGEKNIAELETRVNNKLNGN